MNPAKENSKLLTTNELAANLNLHPATIRADRATGNAMGIPFIRIGGSVRYRPEDVTVYLEKNRVA